MIRIDVRPARKSAVTVGNGRYSIAHGVYTGSYAVEPDERGVTLETKNKVMTDNVSIAPVPAALDGVEIIPDFSGGDFVARADGGTLVRSAVIKKPAALVPENIAAGTVVAGIAGTHQSKPGDVRTVTFVSGGKILCTRSVGDGDNCAEVVSRGIIPEPEGNESLAFCGWASSPDGISDKGVLGAITEDKSVYAVFTSGRAVDGVLFIEYADTAVLADNCLEVS